MFDYAGRRVVCPPRAIVLLGVAGADNLDPVGCGAEIGQLGGAHLDVAVQHLDKGEVLL